MFNSRKWLAGSASIALMGLMGWVAADFSGKPHMAELSCGKCHMLNPATSPEQAYKLVASQETICRSCHPAALQMSHPSGVTPSMKLPAAYPADWKGMLTCSSCHAVHGTTPGLLRGDASGSALCFSCHDRSFFDRMRDRGTSLQQIAHLGGATQPGSEIDTQSLQCIGCHENENSALGIRMGRGSIVLHNSGGANHPIGVRYPLNPGRNGSLRSKGALPKFIVLPDGKLSCVSCHQVYKKEHGKLVTSNEGSALCMQCHSL